MAQIMNQIATMFNGTKYEPNCHNSKMAQNMNQNATILKWHKIRTKLPQFLNGTNNGLKCQQVVCWGFFFLFGLLS
jgi:hypothetical protein